MILRKFLNFNSKIQIDFKKETNSAVRINEVVIHTTKCMNLKNNMSSERS